MHITDLNECLSELPEISVLEYFRGRPVEGPVRWTGEEAVDDVQPVGPICVDDRGIEYVVRAVTAAIAQQPAEVCRVTRPNKTVFFEDMTRSSDIPENVRRALLAFAVTQTFTRVA